MEHDRVEERGVGLAAEHGHLRTLHGIDEPELRLDDAGLRLIAAELQADGAVQLDEIGDAEVSRTAAVSR